MRYFTIEEFTRSDTASKRKINNTPDVHSKRNIVSTIDYLLDPIRKQYGKPIKITSGYRCKSLNTAVGGASNSSHMYGLAADIKPSNGDMATLQAKVLEWAKTHLYDQIIIEQPDNKGIASWLHVGWRRGSDRSQRRQVLIATKVNGKWQYKVFSS